MKKIISLCLLSLGTLLLSMILMEVAITVLMPPSHPTLITDRSEHFYSPQSSRQHPYAKPLGQTKEIYVIGDSFTEGAGVLEVDTFSRKLEYLLNMNDINESILVYNKGISGSSTYQRVHHIKNIVAHNPELVILQITLNDTEDWEDANSFKTWRLETMPQRPKGLWKFVTDHSKLAMFVHSKLSILAAQKGFISYYDHIYNRDYSGWKKFEHALTEFKKTCAESDTQLLAVIFPLFSHSLDTRSYPFTKYHQQIQSELTANGIEFLDLYDSFKDHDHNRMQVIPHIDPHPSEIAHRIAAEAIMKNLLETGKIDASHQPIVPCQVGIHQRWQMTFEKMNPAHKEK